MKESNLYVGKAGHLAVMSELAWRGYNVAMPEIDRGDDLFVVRDESGAMWRLQVKTSKQYPQKKSTRYDFKVKESAIQKPQTPELHFVFVMRERDGWRFLIMDRSILRNYVVSHKLGTPVKVYRRITIILHDDGRAESNGIPLANHLGDWITWPNLRNSE